MNTSSNLKLYYTGTIIGFLFAVIGFSYNAWRLELTEDNNNIRTASFTVLKELAALEQLVYAGHYDKDTVSGNPRNGWIKVGLIVDLSELINPSVKSRALVLKNTWSSNWQDFSHDRPATDNIIDSIEAVRKMIKATLASLD